MSRKVRISIGADPEALLIPPGRLKVGDLDYRRASSVFAFHQPAGWRGGIGHDGAGDQLEVRPRPALRGKTVEQRIRWLLKKAADQSGCYVSVRGDRVPLGCHIHLSGEAIRDNPFRWRQIVEALDWTIGTWALPLSGSARGGYRVLGAYEGYKRHGGFEYRTPPAEVLAVPGLFAVMADIAAATAAAVIEGRFMWMAAECADSPIKAAALVVDKASAGLFGLLLRRCQQLIENGDPLIVAYPDPLTAKPYPPVIWRDAWTTTAREAVGPILEAAALRLGAHIVAFGYANCRECQQARSSLPALHKCRCYYGSSETIPYAVEREARRIWEDTGRNVYVIGLPVSVRVTPTGEHLQAITSHVEGWR